MSEPSRPPPIVPTGVFEGLQPGAILLGIAVDIAATMFAVSLLVALFAARLAREHGPDVPDEALEAMMASPEFLLASMAVGLLCTVLGAYAGCRRAACFFIRHGVWVAVGSALLSVVSQALGGAGDPRPPLWMDIVGLTLMLPAGACGGLLAQWHLRTSA